MRRSLSLALLVATPLLIGAVTGPQRGQLHTWLYTDGLPCGATKIQAEATFDLECPAVPWRLPAELCLTQLANQCTPAPAACTPTAPDSEGPNYLAGAPYTDDLRAPDDLGTLLVVSGTMYGPDCAPVADGELDLWQADSSGHYDFSSDYLYRGIVAAGADGTYSFTTFVPGAYATRAGFLPAHIHAKLSGGGAPVLTTELYFAGDPNLSGTEDPTQLVTLVSDGAGGYTATWDIVLSE